MVNHRWRRAAIAVGLAALGWTANAQAAETLYGTTGTKLVRFSSASPGAIESSRTITGLQPSETVVGIDVRPATGELMALGTTGRLYRIDPGTGASQSISAGPSPLTGTRFGIDFNPAVDRLRAVSDADKNYRYNPIDGSRDTLADLTPPGEVVSIAYDRNTPGAPATTLFGLDSASDKLVRIGGDPPVNQGAVTEIGPTGVDFTMAAGFDVAPGGTAYASLAAGGAPSLHTIDLGTGAATKVGDIGDPAVIDIAVAQPRYTRIIATDASLIRGHTDAPGIESEVFLSGFVGGDVMIAIDQRPATGELIALTDTGRLYLVDPTTATVAQIGSASIAPPLGTDLVGFDVNPVADRIRVVSEAEANYRLDPLTGATIVDSALNPAGSVTAAAYLNSFPGATETVLYDIGSGLTSKLFVQNPPNMGTLTEIGPLETSEAGPPTLAVGSFNGFDIAPAGGFGFLATRPGLATAVSLWRVNLAGGPVTGGRAVYAVDTMPSGEAKGLAIMSPGVLSVGSTSALETSGSVRVAVARAGGATGPATVEYATADGSAKAGEDYTAAGGVLRFADGETAKLIDVPLLDDAAFEEPETFTLTLSKPGEGALLGAATATVTLGSEDAAPAASPVPAPAPTPPVVVADTTKPLAFLTARPSQTIKTVRSKGLRLQLVAGEPATATLTAAITSATAKKLKLSKRTIATGKATFTAAGVKSITLKLTSKAKSALKKSKKPVAVSLAATVTDLAKNASSTKASVVLPVK